MNYDITCTALVEQFRFHSSILLENTMYGIEAINAANGWSMALVGWFIVFSGLIVLSFAISKLHLLVSFFDKEKTSTDDSKKPIPLQVALSNKWPTDIREHLKLYQPVIDELESSFPLAELYALANKHNLPHPHLTISEFRRSGILVSFGEGIFSWHLQ